MPAQTQAGDLDRRITIQRATFMTSDYNEPIETWSDLVTLWAKHTDASSAEMYRAQEIGAQISCRFLVRSYSVTRGLTPEDRIIYANRSYNITGVKEVKDTRNAWVEIDAVARADK